MRLIASIIRFLKRLRCLAGHSWDNVAYRCRACTRCPRVQRYVHGKGWENFP